MILQVELDDDPSSLALVVEALRQAAEVRRRVAVKAAAEVVATTGRGTAEFFEQSALVVDVLREADVLEVVAAAFEDGEAAPGGVPPAAGAAPASAPAAPPGRPRMPPGVRVGVRRQGGTTVVFPQLVDDEDELDDEEVDVEAVLGEEGP